MSLVRMPKKPVEYTNVKITRLTNRSGIALLTFVLQEQHGYFCTKRLKNKQENTACPETKTETLETWRKLTVSNCIESNGPTYFCADCIFRITFTKKCNKKSYKK